MRKIFACALALGLTLLACCPLSLCAVSSSMSDHCASMEPQSPCAGMSMDVHTAQAMGAADTSCCAISQVPLPESKSELSRATVQKMATTTLMVSIGLAYSENDVFADVSQDLSPPSLQSFLCTFLI
jgi:hypothetical protein